MTAAAPTPLIDWAVATRPVAGESVSGDLHFVASTAHGALAAAIDGLGHGPEAAAAAAAAAAVLAREAGAPPTQLIAACHAELRKTRGATMSLAAFDGAGALSWAGVGDVEGVLLRADPANGSPVPILLRAGVVGSRLPALRETAHPVWPGDLLILTTDGVRRDFVTDALKTHGMDEAPATIAELILAGHAKANDDALVLVARYLGGRP